MAYEKQPYNGLNFVTDNDFFEDDDFSRQTIEKLAATDFDCLVVVSFGRMIPKEVLDITGSCTINVHPSLLPKYRGPSPITTAL